MLSKIVASSAFVCALGACGGSEITEHSRNASSVQSALAVPNDGNGNKDVVVLARTSTKYCGSEPITVDLFAVIQTRDFPQPNNPNIELELGHATTTYTNAAGAQWVWHQVGVSRVYMDGASFFVDASGRIQTNELHDGNRGFIGHVTLNLATGEFVFVAGQEFESALAEACARLT